MNKNISKDLYIASLYFLYILLFYKVDIITKKWYNSWCTIYFLEHKKLYVYMMTNGKKLLMPRVSYNTLVGTNVTIVIIRERDKVMEALKIKIRDGFFSGTNKVNLESATKTKVVGNGWVATIEKDGTISAFFESWFYNILKIIILPNFMLPPRA